MMQTCAAGESRAAIDAAANRIQPSDDVETNYFTAAHLAYCGQTSAALRLLQRAVEGNYCSFPAMDRDPMFVRLRQRPEFAAIRTAGVACRDRFLAGRQGQRGGS